MRGFHGQDPICATVAVTTGVPGAEIEFAGRKGGECDVPRGGTWGGAAGAGNGRNIVPWNVTPFS